MRFKVAAYYQMVKPGVMWGNVLTGVAGFLLAARGDIDWWLFLATIGGMTLVVSSACVLNNFLDRDIDKLMTRTVNRPSLTGVVSAAEMQIYAWVLFVLGFMVLGLWTNWLVVAVGLVGYVTYVWFYGAWSKRRSLHGTLVGSISGAMPIAGGYVAVAGQLDWTLLVLVLALFFWQFPEFYSISIYRQREYAKAKIPVISVVKGARYTASWIAIYTLLYVLSTVTLGFVAGLGLVYLIIMTVFGLWWLGIASQFWQLDDFEPWSRKMFGQAMIHILLFSLMISIGGLLP